jgi:hypothetical protein
VNPLRHRGASSNDGSLSESDDRDLGVSGAAAAVGVTRIFMLGLSIE